MTVGLIALVAVALASPAFGEEQAIRKAAEDVCRALRDADVEYLDRHYLPEVTRFHPNGRLDVGWTAQKLASFKNAAEKGRKYVIEKCEVIDARVYGETGITAGHMYGHIANADGSIARGPWRFTYVWVKQGTAWKEAHHHVSPLSQ